MVGEKITIQDASEADPNLIRCWREDWKI